MVLYLSGFTDYTKFYDFNIHLPNIILGIVLISGSTISIIPQIISFIKGRSNYGMSVLTLVLISFGQFALLLNYVILNPFDFINFYTQPLKNVFPNLMSFMTFFALWYTYLGNAYLNFIFYDKKVRANRSSHDIRIQRISNLVFTMILFGGDFIILVVYYIFMMSGINSKVVDGYGITLGIICSAISFVQYIPQIVTTCRLRGPGTLSLAMLLMQAPGGLANVYMIAFVNKKNWSTWLPIFVACCQQFLLIAIIIFFKCIKKKDATTLSDSLLDSSDIDARR